MAFGDYSTTPSANTTIAGKNIAEGCPPGNLNDAVRQLMADGKALSNAMPDTSALLPKAGGEVTGDITRQGRGAHLHHASSANTDGRVYLLPLGSPRPTATSGAIVFYYV